MRDIRISVLGVLAAAALSVTLAQCSGSGGSASSTPPTPATNAGGQYSIASATDSLYGSSTTCANETCPTLVQNGTAVTGSVGIAFATANVVFGPFTWTLTGANSQFSGTMPGAVTSGTVTANCTFDVSGNFNQEAANVNSEFSVDYTSVQGCSGQSGTFVLQQQCTTNNVAGSAVRARRRIQPDHVVLPC
ncbi:MAG: hypothetical protein ACLQPV_08630 [Vulcanimicrobiaceae bacterium]